VNARRSSLHILLLAALLALPAAASNQRSALVKWRSTSDGMAEAGKSGKPLLYFFTADWCGPCHLMKDEVFADRELAALVERDYVPVEVVDRSRETGRNAKDIDELFEKYEIRGFPTLVVTRPKSKSAVYVTGFPGREKVASFLRTVRQQLRDMEKERGKK
jgi:thioredoxin-related protein